MVQKKHLTHLKTKLFEFDYFLYLTIFYTYLIKIRTNNFSLVDLNLFFIQKTKK